MCVNQTCFGHLWGVSAFTSASIMSTAKAPFVWRMSSLTASLVLLFLNSWHWFLLFFFFILKTEKFTNLTRKDLFWVILCSGNGRWVGREIFACRSFRNSRHTPSAQMFLALQDAPSMDAWNNGVFPLATFATSEISAFGSWTSQCLCIDCSLYMLESTPKFAVF